MKIETLDELKRFLCDMGYEYTVVFETTSYVKAFVGVTHDGRAIYEYEKMAKCLMDEDGMTYEEAAEFVDYNTIRSIPYFEGAPVVMYTFDI